MYYVCIINRHGIPSCFSVESHQLVQLQHSDKLRAAIPEAAPQQPCLCKCLLSSKTMNLLPAVGVLYIFQEQHDRGTRLAYLSYMCS